jgi:hypothetical protein
MLICARLRNCDRIIRCIETLQQFSSECLIRFSANGWYIQVVNPYGASCGELSVNPSRFDEFKLHNDDSVVDYYISLSDLLDNHLLRHKDDKSVVLQMNSLPNDQLEFTVLYSRVMPPSTAESNAITTLPTPTPPPLMTSSSVLVRYGGVSDAVSTQRSLHASSAQRSHISPASLRKRKRTHKRSHQPQNVVTEKHSFVLPSNNDVSCRDRYVDLSASLLEHPSMIDTKMDANNLNAIFRESSVIDKKIYLLVHTETNQLLFYTHGEKGELKERCTGIERMRSRSEVELRVTPMATPTPVVVSEQYSNRFIKFFSKIMHQPHYVHASFTPAKPLVLTINLNTNVRIRAHISPWTETQPQVVSSCG